MCMGIDTAIGLRVCMTTKKFVYLSVLHFIVYISLYMNCKSQEATPETLLMICFMRGFHWYHSGTFHTSDYCK